MRAPVLCVLAITLVGCGDDDDGPVADASVDAGADAARDAMIDARIADTGPDAAPVCGDQMIDPGEQCDRGTFNGMAGVACSSTCQSLELTANTTTAANQGATVEAKIAGLDIAATAAGWVVVWTDGNIPSTDIRTRLYDRFGAARTQGIDGSKNDFVANRRRAPTQLAPRVAARNTTSDDYAVAWTERDGALGTGRARRFGGDGTPADMDLVDEVNLGASDLSLGMVTSVGTLQTTSVPPMFVHVFGWRETGGTLAGRTMQASDLTSVLAPTTIAMNVASDAMITLSPRAGGTLLGLLDRGTGNNLVRAGISETLVAGAPLTTIGASAPHGMAGLPSGRTVIATATSTAFAGPLSVVVHDDGAVLRAFSVGANAASPGVAAGAMGFVVTWIERPASGRDRVRAILLDGAGATIVNPAWGAAEVDVSTRATSAGAGDLGVDAPRAAVASDGSVMIAWRDHGARTGAGTGADTGAEIHVRLLPRVVPR